MARPTSCDGDSLTPLNCCAQLRLGIVAKHLRSSASAVSAPLLGINDTHAAQVSSGASRTVQTVHREVRTVVTTTKKVRQVKTAQSSATASSASLAVNKSATNCDKPVVSSLISSACDTPAASPLPKLASSVACAGTTSIQTCGTTTSPPRDKSSSFNLCDVPATSAGCVQASASFCGNSVSSDPGVILTSSSCDALSCTTVAGAPKSVTSSANSCNVSVTMLDTSCSGFSRKDGRLLFGHTVSKMSDPSCKLPIDQSGSLCDVSAKRTSTRHDSRTLFARAASASPDVSFLPAAQSKLAATASVPATCAAPQGRCCCPTCHVQCCGSQACSRIQPELGITAKPLLVCEEKVTTSAPAHCAVALAAKCTTPPGKCGSPDCHLASCTALLCQPTQPCVVRLHKLEKADCDIATCEVHRHCVLSKARPHFGAKHCQHVSLVHGVSSLHSASSCPPMVECFNGKYETTEEAGCRRHCGCASPCAHRTGSAIHCACSRTLAQVPAVSSQFPCVPFSPPAPPAVLHQTFQSIGLVIPLPSHITLSDFSVEIEGHRDLRVFTHKDSNVTTLSEWVLPASLLLVDQTRAELRDSELLISFPRRMHSRI